MTTLDIAPTIELAEAPGRDIWSQILNRVGNVVACICEYLNEDMGPVEDGDGEYFPTGGYCGF